MWCDFPSFSKYWLFGSSAMKTLRLAIGLCTVCFALNWGCICYIFATTGYRHHHYLQYLRYHWILSSFLKSTVSLNMKGASWAASNRRLAFKVPAFESQKLRGVWQRCSGSGNSKILSDTEPNQWRWTSLHIRILSHFYWGTSSCDFKSWIFATCGTLATVSSVDEMTRLKRNDVQRHLQWNFCHERRSESTKDRPNTALYQGIDAVLKDLVAAPEACRRVTGGMMCCALLTQWYHLIS